MSTKNTMKDGHPKRIPIAPYSQLPSPTMPKVAGKDAAAAAGSFAPATHAKMSPGRVNTAMASHTAPTASMRSTSGQLFRTIPAQAVYSVARGDSECTSEASRRSRVTVARAASSSSAG